MTDSIITVLNNWPEMPVLLIETRYLASDTRIVFEDIDQIDRLIRSLETVKTYYPKHATTESPTQ